MTIFDETIDDENVSMNRLGMDRNKFAEWIPSSGIQLSDKYGSWVMLAFFNVDDFSIETTN